MRFGHLMKITWYKNTLLLSGRLFSTFYTFGSCVHGSHRSCSLPFTWETAPFSNDYFVSLRAVTFAEAVCQTRKLRFSCLDSSDPEPMHSFLAVQCLYFLPKKEEDNEVEVQMSDWVPLFLGFSFFLCVSLERDSTCLSL